jgi:hypothetical protein
MTRLCLGHFIIVGLLFWGLPAFFVVGPLAILYTIAAVLPVWWFCLRDSHPPVVLNRHISTLTCAVLAGFSVVYLIGDALFGRKLLQFNMFLFRDVGAARIIEESNAGMSKGVGVADLLGIILFLLPFCLIDAARNTSRYGRWILWAIVILFIFYQSGSGRGTLMMAVFAIALGRRLDWRLILVAAASALAAFALASNFRGDSAGAENPLLSGITWPFINLALMQNAHCGTAPWYSFLAEFLKKFLPAFLFPKTIFSFNMEMSLCVYPSVYNMVDSISIYTWLGEIFYYKPSLLTALLAGSLMGIMAHEVDRRFVRNQMYSARLFAGLMCIQFLRSRTQDMFTFLIAQFIFLAIFWPQICGLTRTSGRFLIPPHLVSAVRGLKMRLGWPARVR